MLHEAHACGLIKIEPKTVKPSSGLHHIGEAGPIWGSLLPLLFFILRKPRQAVTTKAEDTQRLSGQIITQS